jgi:hypothetical protein
MHRVFNRTILTFAAACVFGLQIGAPAFADEPHGHGEPHGEPHGAFHGEPHGQVLDSRYNHGHYYPAYGTTFHSLPGGYRPYYYHGSPYYFSGGVWYAPGPGGFLVVRPPFGLAVTVLPPYYSTVWIAGSPYYYADNVYYTWDPAQNGYVVVSPPDGADQPEAAPAQASVASSDLIVYPKNGQTTDQQAADRYECHSWAKGQTGFDPTQAGGGVPGGNVEQARANYNRAMSACLQARGYQVN